MAVEELAPGAMLLRGLIDDTREELLRALREVVALAPLRHMTTPGGFRMSVAMSNCGRIGWVTDRAGYRYTPHDPLTAERWPAMPERFAAVAALAASRAGYAGFAPDACLIGCYEPGARLSLHQDRDERELGAPIVSVSLGLSATFLFGGESRSERVHRIRVHHGDVIVWGGPARLRFHGVAPLEVGHHPATGAHRFNLSFRQAG